VSELIHNKKDILNFRTVITVLEFHDYNPPSYSDDDFDSSGSSLIMDGILGRETSSSLRPWPTVR
jgi:hypothetical protein